MVLAADLSWRAAVVRDEGPDGALGSALQRQGLTPVACPVLVEGPPPDPGALDRAARMLEQHDWVVVASARSVKALTRVRGGAWQPRPDVTEVARLLRACRDGAAR